MLSRHVLTVNIEGEKKSVALSWSLWVRCRPAGIETCANFEARQDGRYSDGTIRIASGSKGLRGIVDSTKSKKNKKLISNQLRV